MCALDLPSQQIEEVAPRQRTCERVMARLGGKQRVGRLQLLGEIARAAMVTPLAHIRNSNDPRERHLGRGGVVVPDF